MNVSSGERWPRLARLRCSSSTMLRTSATWSRLSCEMQDLSYRTAGNGLEALLAAYEMKPAVIVMDVTMPVLDGIEATRLIKATEGIRESKVIAHTGNTSIPALNKRWFVAVVPKPSPPGSRSRGGSERSQCIVSPTPRVNRMSLMPLRALMVQQCEAR